MKKSRRDFLKKTIAGTTAISLGGVLPGFSAASYRNIPGANDKIRVASMGVNSRGFALGSNFAAQPNAEVLYCCDVDTRAADRYIAAVEKIQHKRPLAQPDFRKALEDKHLDILVGTPLNSGILGGHQSTLLVQLGNIALRSGRVLTTDPKNGHILNDNDALKYWSREYEPGWEQKA